MCFPGCPAHTYTPIFAVKGELGYSATVMSCRAPTARAGAGLFSASHEMAYGEQAVLCGVLAVLKPRLALELGTFRGGSLAPIAAHSREVHTFDLASHVTEVLPNVTYHIGDSRVTLPRILSELAEAHKHVDFVLVDGDHSRAGVEADMSHLLQSPALSTTVILLHDCANEGVREGARKAILRADGLAYADLSFIAPPTRRTSPLRDLWGGLGIVVVDRPGGFWTLERQILPNVKWHTSGARSLAWHALRPVRSLKRDVVYRTRPLYRRVAGSRGAKL